MAIKPFLGRLVVIGRHDKGGIRAGLLGVFRQHDGFLGRVRAGAGDHRDPTLGHPDADFHDPHMLVVAQRRRFAGRAAGHQPVGSLFDLPVDELFVGRIVHRSVPKRRHKRAN